MTKEADMDFLLHYGKKGMKWGERKAARQEKNANIDSARGAQGKRHAELSKLKMERLNATSNKGKEHLDRKIADKKFEISNHPDAHAASQLKTAEKWMKGAKIAAMMGVAVVGMGTAASILNTELNNMDNSNTHDRTVVTGGANKILVPGYSIVGGKVIPHYVSSADKDLAFNGGG